MTRALLTLLLLAIAAIPAPAQTSEVTLFQKPTASRTQVAFVYAGDLWIVDRKGGDAKRLTAGTGTETTPFFSPDGNWIAFTGEYDGNTDVYVVPAAGGVPTRLTYHPGGDTVVGWTPDGKSVLFRSNRNSYSSFTRLFTISPGSTVPVEVPLPMANEGSLSPDSSRIAYQPLSQWQPDWKRHQGGQTTPIWIARLSDSSIEKLPRENSNDFNPMWVGDKVYFLSDRSGAVTLFAYDTASKKVTQLVQNSGMDLKSASAGPDVIAYEQFGSLYLYDLKGGREQKLAVRVNGDFPGVRPRFEKVGTRLINGSLSPTGVRAAFEARGEILTLPADKGDPRNLTNTPGVMERDPAWSPDGKWVAYYSDESGEYALHVREQNGFGEPRKIALGTPPSFYYSPTWSPDSKKIAYYDRAMNLYYIDLDKGTPVKIDKNPYVVQGDVMQPFWAPDSRWVAYAKQGDNRMRAVFVYSLESAKSTQITDGMSDARHVAFDPSGKYIYFTASTNLGPAIGFAEMSTFPHQSSRNVYAVVLRNDLPSPVAPESDEEKVQEERRGAPRPANAPDQPTDSKPEGAQAAAPGQPGGPGGMPGRRAPEPVRIDFDGIDQRVIALPIPARNYIDLKVGKAGNVFLMESPPPGSSGVPGLILHRFDLDKRKFDKVVEGVGGLEVSHNGEKMMFRQGTNWVIASTMMPIRPGEGALRTADVEVRVDPKAEWRQMYNEAWRGERDFFYDPGLHGVNLEEFKRRYAPYVEAVAHRSDLNYLFREMLNQLTVGHLFVGGGDQPQANSVPGGLLGADYSVENGRYRFAKVYNGENWNPQARAPLTQPGVNVKPGEYLLAVRGRNLTASDNLYALFEGTAGKQVMIRVGPNPDGTGSREVTVVPASDETSLRNLDWIEGNRRKVDQMSGGKLAYVYVPNTGGGGYTNFNRYFFAQTQKQGAVIDERFNGGGALADYIVEYLSRPLLNYIAFRDGRELPVPLGAIYGPKVMLINELAGSGGDALPWYFRKMKIGSLIGKRTWGGLVRSAGMPPLMDGGGATAPDAAIYGLNGEWEVENVGVAPDIEIEFDPAAWRQGRDPQLEKAVEVAMEELRKNPPPQHKRPPYPNYHTKQPAGK